MEQLAFAFVNDIVPLCACGCGKTVTRSQTSPHRWNRYLPWHNHRMLINRKIAKTRGEAPLCKCGCGDYVAYGKQAKKWNTFLRGHMSKTPEDKERKRKRLAKLQKDPNFDQKRREGLRKWWADPTNQARQKEWASNKSPEERARASAFLSQRNLKQWSDPEYRSQMIKRLRKMGKDPVFRQKRSEYQRERWANDIEFSQTVRRKARARMLACWRDPDYIDRTIRACNRSPNKLEKSFDSKTPDFVRFVGDGSFYLTLTKMLDNGEYVRQIKNPDFLVDGTKKVIELFGDYFHAGERPENLIKSFSDIGWECMVIWEHEWYENQESILEQVNKFVERT